MVLDSLTRMYYLSDFKKGLKLALEGVQLGEKNNRKDILICFKAYSLKMKFQLGKITQKNVLYEIKKLINQFKCMDFPSIRWKQLFLYNMNQLTSSVKEQEGIRFYCLYKYNEIEIICNGLNLSLRSLYFMKWNKILKEITHETVEYDVSASKNYLVLNKMKNEYISKLDSSIIELSCSKKTS